MGASSYAPGQVIVKYRDGVAASTKAGLAERLGLGKLLGRVSANGAEVVSISGNVADTVVRLNRSDAVLYAESNKILRATANPNDARFGELYGIHNTGQSGGTADADMDGPEAWDAAGLGGFPPALTGVKVGIVDTGIDRAHEDLNAPGKVVNCAGTAPGLGGIIGGNPTPTESRGCTDDNDHGTHVAGTIAATANNAVGVAGVSFNSPLGICKALHGVLGSGSTAGVANCITYLSSRGNRIISMSLGGGASATLASAVQTATNQHGALLIAAAGNDGDTTVSYPAGYPEVMSVAATDRNDARASFSNMNADVEIAAAGVDVLSSKRGGGYVAFSGTSMATPHVAGAAAVVMKTAGTAAATRSRLNSFADDKGTPGKDNSFGNGRVNLARAVAGS